MKRRSDSKRVFEDGTGRYRIFHAPFQAFMPRKAHGQCGKGAICATQALSHPTNQQYQAIIYACTQARSLQTPMQQHSATSARRFSPTRFIRRDCAPCSWPAPLRGRQTLIVRPQKHYTSAVWKGSTRQAPFATISS
jgi:hypothetical protein